MPRLSLFCLPGVSWSLLERLIAVGRAPHVAGLLARGCVLNDLPSIHLEERDWWQALLAPGARLRAPGPMENSSARHWASVHAGSLAPGAWCRGEAGSAFVGLPDDWREGEQDLWLAGAEYTGSGAVRGSLPAGVPLEWSVPRCLEADPFSLSLTLTRAAREQLETARRLMEARSWTAWFQTLPWMDWLGHAFTAWSDRSDAFVRGTPLLRLWDEIDRYLGDLTSQLAAGGTSLILVCPWSIARYHGLFVLNRWLEEAGFLRRRAATTPLLSRERCIAQLRAADLGDEWFSAEPTPPEPVDLDRSAAYADGPGVLLTRTEDRSELTRMLLALRDETGSAVIDSVWEEKTDGATGRWGDGATGWGAEGPAVSRSPLLRFSYPPSASLRAVSTSSPARLLSRIRCVSSRYLLRADDGAPGPALRYRPLDYHAPGGWLVASGMGPAAAAPEGQDLVEVTRALIEWPSQRATGEAQR